MEADIGDASDGFRVADRAEITEENRRLLKSGGDAREISRESGLQAHPLLTSFGSIRLYLRLFLLCPWRARYLESLPDLHNPAGPLP